MNIIFLLNFCTNRRNGILISSLLILQGCRTVLHMSLLDCANITIKDRNKDNISRTFSKLPERATSTDRISGLS
jgi:hypothetical protein